MCWITLTPTKKKRNSTASDCSSADIVRVHSGSSKRRFSNISIALPSTIASTTDAHQQHHHGHSHGHSHSHCHHHHQGLNLHPHAPLPHGLLQHHHRRPHLHALHPLHLHPITPLHGVGKKLVVGGGSGGSGVVVIEEESNRAAPPRPRRPAPSCAAPGGKSSLSSSSSSSSTSTSTSSSSATNTLHYKPKEPVYRTQIVEPSVRTSTRSALRDVRGGRSRGRVRRVGGYEVLGKRVPWDWDCVSSTVGSSGGGGGRGGGGKWKGGTRFKYPPFGAMERWL